MSSNKEISFEKAINMNRAERRRLGKFNNVKIPSIENLKKKIDPKKSDNFFNNIFNKSK